MYTKQKTCDCKWCYKPTAMLGTKCCDRCYELSNRIRSDLILAQTMINKFVAESNAWDDELETLGNPYQANSL